MPRFFHHDLQLLNPRFDSPLLDVLTDLEHLRRLEIKADDTPTQIKTAGQLALFNNLKDHVAAEPHAPQAEAARAARR